MQTIKNKKTLAYIALWFVIFVWGTAPLLTKFLLGYYSGTASVLHTSILGFIFFFIVSIKKLKELNSTYFKIAVTTGIFYSAADILQKVGLQYTTPTRYAFLENLSCVIVPILLFFLIKKKPSALTIISALLCLVGAYLLSADGGNVGGGIGIGEILCALAGLCYGVNIAVTGVYAKKFHPSLYLMIQMGVASVMSALSSIVFNYVTINGVIVEPFKFTFEWKIFLLKCAVTLISSSLCWLIRTWSMKRVSANVVAVMMPMSSVITAVASVIIGNDVLTTGLVVGGSLGLVATILSEFGDKPKKTKENEDIVQERNGN
jgi:drug/metabolite transporter (DMT)-like permease